MNLEERVVKETQGWIEYYEKRLEGVKKHETNLVELVKKLDTLGSFENVSMSYNSIDITLETIEEARSLLSKVLQETEVERFIKVSHAYGDSLRWGYNVDYKGIALTIYPCEPSKDCVAVKKVNTYTTWVCEKKENV